MRGTVSRRHGGSSVRFDPPLRAGRLLRRYKRFLADIAIESGDKLTIHCPNPGAMTGCDAPGSRVWYSTSTNSSRKYRHSLELVETVESHWVGVNPTRANAVVGEALEAGTLCGIVGSVVRSESQIPGEAGRFDFHLRDDSGRNCYIEVKSVTLLRGDGLGAFPDAPSERARRHVAALQRVRESGHRALLIFCVQHNGVDRVTCADDVDPEYGRALRRARQTGVEVLAFAAEVSPRRIVIGDALPVIL
jgi:sugar fermentation stimulation protein A